MSGDGGLGDLLERIERAQAAALALNKELVEIKAQAESVVSLALQDHENRLREVLNVLSKNTNNASIIQSWARDRASVPAGAQPAQAAVVAQPATQAAVLGPPVSTFQGGRVVKYDQDGNKNPTRSQMRCLRALNALIQKDHFGHMGVYSAAVIVAAVAEEDDSATPGTCYKTLELAARGCFPRDVIPSVYRVENPSNRRARFYCFYLEDGGETD